MASFKNKTQAAAVAKSEGKTTFQWVCEKHGETSFFSASRQCMHCSRERKDPVKNRENFHRWIAVEANRERHRATTAANAATPEGKAKAVERQMRYRGTPEGRAAYNAAKRRRYAEKKAAKAAAE